MVFKKELYKIELTEKYRQELQGIYYYISNILNAEKAAINLFQEIDKKFLNLKKSPELYQRIGKFDKLKREYRRIVVKNYVILYTIDYDNKTVYVSRIIYGRRNYMAN